MKKIRFTFFLLALLISINALTSCNIIKNQVEVVDKKEERLYVTNIQKYGNLELSISGTDFLNSGYEFGDVITVSIAGKNYDMPICPNYTDVSQGEFICRVWVEEDVNENTVLICKNLEDFATDMNIARKETTSEAPGFKWVYLVNEPCYVDIAMKEKAGYKEQYLMNSIMSTRSNNREDYSEMSDEEFTNFRMVKTSNIREGVLYRSSSPVNPKYARNKYADIAAKIAGINTFINLADDEKTMKSYEGFNDSYYSTKNILPLNLDIAVNGEEFRKGIAHAIRFIDKNDGPYLVHCDEGKDRAGFMIAILECMMGATAEEVVNDYMVTYYNYYHIKKSNPIYENIKKMNIEKSLAKAFDVPDIYNADLTAECEDFLLSIGLTKDEITLARNKLS